MGHALAFLEWYIDVVLVHKVGEPGGDRRRHRHRFYLHLTAVQIVLRLVGANGREADLHRLVAIGIRIEHHEHHRRIEREIVLVPLCLAFEYFQSRGHRMISDTVAVASKLDPFIDLRGARQDVHDMPGVIDPFGVGIAPLDHHTDLHRAFRHRRDIRCLAVMLINCDAIKIGQLRPIGRRTNSARRAIPLTFHRNECHFHLTTTPPIGMADGNDDKKIMKSKAIDRTVFICDCEGTMPLDRKAIAKAGIDGTVVECTYLCRREIDRFTDAAGRDQEILVACTQEAPLFDETANEIEAPARINYTNIRERAGWSDEAKSATPKILALLAEAALETPETRTVSLRSDGAVLVYGDGAEVIDAARQLSDRMNVTCLLRKATDVMPPRSTDFAIYQGTIAGLTGYLGAFEATVKSMTPSLPSARDAIEFAEQGEDALVGFDLVLDLTRGAALVSGPEHRDGYFKPDAGSPAAVQRALYEISNLIGEFEKPRYVAYDESICVHSRNRITGCSRCLDACPAGAITDAGDHVAIDPHICGGCGICASVCPTGAASYARPSLDFLAERLRTLLESYRKHGGKAPVLLVHDTDYGEELIAVMARAGRGLPAHVIPFAVNEVTQIGHAFLCGAFAYGASNVALLVAPKSRDDLDGLHFQIELTEALLEGLGYGAERIALIDEIDPDAVAELLHSAKPAKPAVAGSFLVLGGARSASDLALGHLHEHAPKPIDMLDLPDGAPYGDIEVATDGCTMCLSCVTACPTGAFRDDPDSPTLRFVERACVQCGICRSTCPEKVISLKPRLNFLDSVRDSVVKNEEEPFNCVRCGNAFGVKSSVEHMVEKLTGHSMFKDEAALNRIRMCPDCRVLDMATDNDPDLGGGPRPKTRTTDDYLREQAEEKAGPPRPRRGNGRG